MQGSKKPPEMYKIEDEVAGIIEDLDLYSYYQLLELRQDAAPEIVDYHYHAKKDQFDKLKRDIYCGPKLYKNIDILLDRIEEGYQVLSDPKLRREYDERLVEGHTRHYQVVHQRSIPMPLHVEQDEYLEKVTSGLQKKLGEEFLHAEDDEEVEGRQAIDEEYLEEAVDHLSRKLEQAKIDLHSEEAEEEEPVEDQSADASFAHELVEELEGELSEFGLEDLGIRSDDDLQEELERKRLARELQEASPQIPALQGGVAPLISSLYDSGEEEKQDFMPKRLEPRLNISQPAPAATEASRSEEIIDLDDDSDDEGEYAAAADEPQPSPREDRVGDDAPALVDDVIQLDEDD